mgnify:CR=1 FL=1
MQVPRARRLPALLHVRLQADPLTHLVLLHLPRVWRHAPASRHHACTHQKGTVLRIEGATRCDRLQPDAPRLRSRASRRQTSPSSLPPRVISRHLARLAALSRQAEIRLDRRRRLGPLRQRSQRPRRAGRPLPLQPRASQAATLCVQAATLCVQAATLCVQTATLCVQATRCSCGDSYSQSASVGTSWALRAHRGCRCAGVAPHVRVHGTLGEFIVAPHCRSRHVRVCVSQTLGHSVHCTKHGRVPSHTLRLEPWRAGRCYICTRTPTPTRMYICAGGDAARPVVGRRLGGRRGRRAGGRVAPPQVARGAARRAAVAREQGARVERGAATLYSRGCNPLQ